MRRRIGREAALCAKSTEFSANIADPAIMRHFAHR
jgi:hypothetical protein